MVTEKPTRDQEILLADNFVRRQIEEAWERGREDKVAKQPPQPFPPDMEKSFTRDQQTLYNDGFVERQIKKVYQEGDNSIG